MEQISEHEHDQHQQAFNFGLNPQIASSSSSSASCHHILFSSTQDHAAFYRPQLYQPHHQPEGGNCGFHGKWMPKEGDRGVPTTIIAAVEIEVKKVEVEVQVETDLSSNSSSYNYCYSPIRVCTDCHTTKTPLWRSGPKGPKSLCNACGIRQRKARRAMAAAAANGGEGGVSDPRRGMKVKEKNGKNGHSSKLKKRCKFTAAATGGGSSTSSGKKMGFEDFLINLSNKVAFHRVFPQDEKEAAILLMALSSGLVHG